MRHKFVTGLCLFGVILSAAVPARALKGGVNDADSMQPSVTVLVPPKDTGVHPQPIAPPRAVTGRATDIPSARPPSTPIRDPKLPKIQPPTNNPAGTTVHPPPLWGAAEESESAEQKSSVWLQPNVWGEPKVVPPSPPAPASPAAAVRKPFVDPDKGVKSWAPGYAIKLVPQAARQRVGQLAIPQSQAWTNLRSLLTNHATAAQLSQRPVLPQLRAVTMALPTDRATNWDDWYKKVAQAVYETWQQSGTGAGTAKLQIKVYPSRDVDCSIIDFSPATDLKRNQETESAFREAAIHAVNALNRSAVWQYPATAARTKQVIIELELKHLVGTPPGCRVIRTHNS